MFGGNPAKNTYIYFFRECMHLIYCVVELVLIVKVNQMFYLSNEPLNVNALVKMGQFYQKPWNIILLASPITLDFIFCDLMRVYFCTSNLMHGYWSLGKSNIEGSWQWSLIQSIFLLRQESRVFYEQWWKSFEV